MFNTCNIIDILGHNASALPQKQWNVIASHVRNDVGGCLLIQFSIMVTEPATASRYVNGPLGYELHEEWCHHQLSSQEKLSLAVLAFV